MLIRFLNFSFGLLALLPLRVLHAIGGVLGELAWRLPGRYQTRLDENFLKAFPNATKSDRKEAARQVGKMAMELPWLWVRKNPQEIDEIMTWTFWPVLEDLLAEKKGLIFLTPHLGSFEALGQAVALHVGCTGLYRPPHKAGLDVWLEQMRGRKNLRSAIADVRGVRKLVKALKRGELIGILPDQAPSAGEGVWAPFYGRPAYTMTLVLRLQQLTGAPIVFGFAERLPKGKGFDVHIQKMDGPLSNDPVEAAKQINQGLERLIASAPNQYLWGYHRFKHPAGAELPPDYATPVTSPPSTSTTPTA